MTLAAAYMRCSGKGQVEGDTWDRQIQAIQNCAAAKDLMVIHEFREEAISGKNGEEQRPAFQAMIGTLLGNGCRTIIVESLDRLAREYRIQEQLIIYIASKDLTLIAANTGENITEAMMGDPMRRALVQIQGIFAELDKNMLIHKLADARRRLRTKMGRCEGRKPYGSRGGEAMTLSIIEHQAKLGVRPEYIAAYLNGQNLPTRYGKRWHAGTVSKILKRQKDL